MLQLSLILSALITIPKALAPIYGHQLSLESKLTVTFPDETHSQITTPPLSTAIIWWQQDPTRWKLICAMNNTNAERYFRYSGVRFDPRQRAALLHRAGKNQQFGVLLNDNSWLEVFSFSIDTDNESNTNFLTIPNAVFNSRLLDYWYENT